VTSTQIYSEKWD